MKNFIYLFLGVVFLTGCTGYGDKLQYNKTEVYYTSSIEKNEAEKLGDFLVSSGFAGDNEKSVQLSKDDESGNYQFRMVTTKEAAESESYETIFKVFAKQISDSVFQKKPVDFHVCDNTFNMLKVIAFENETE